MTQPPPTEQHPPHGASPRTSIACVDIESLTHAAYLYEPIFSHDELVDLHVIARNEAASALALAERVAVGSLVTEVFIDVHIALEAATVAWHGGVPDRYTITRRGLVDGAMTTIRFEIATQRVGDLILQTSYDQTVDHQLEQSEGRLEAILESLDEAITISQPLFDDDLQLVGLRTLYANDSASRLHRILKPFEDRGVLNSRIDRLRRVLEVGTSVTSRVDNIDGALRDAPMVDLEVEESSVGGLAVEVVRNHTERRMATLADERAKRRFATTIDALGDAVGIFEPVFAATSITNFRLVYANRAMAQVLTVGSLISYLSSGGDSLVDLGRRTMRRPDTAMHSSFTTHPGSQLRTWRASMVAVDDQLVVVAADVTDIHHALTRATESEHLLRTVLDSLDESVQVFDVSGHLRYANAASTDLLGPRCRDGQSEDSPTTRLLEADADVEIASEHWPLERGKRGESVDGLVLRVDRPEVGARTCSVTVRPITNPGTNDPSMVVVSAHDITEERTHAAELEWLSTHSDQSGLLNREGLTRQISRHFIDEGLEFTVIWIKLTALDALRPTFGFAIVDDAVADAALRLNKIAGEHGGLAAHPSENALALVVPAMDRAAVSKLLHEIITRLSVPVSTASITILLEPVAGVADGPDDDADLETLLHRAKSAAWSAENTTSTQAFWQPHHGSEQIRRVALLGDFERALGSGEVTLAYQPKFAVVSGRLVGAEALTRWTHPIDGPLRPDEFIPAVEASGLAVPFTLWVVERSLSDWEQVAERSPNTSVAVNAPARLVADRSFHDELAAIIDRRQTAPGTLRLEITERAVGGQTSPVIEGIDRLRDIGVSVSMDDFGTGESSLANLGALRVAEVKVDRAFVANAATDAVHLSVLRACADIGRSAGISVCAEGIETPEQLQLVTDLGFDTVQGYLTGRPQPIDGLVSLAASRSGHFVALSRRS